MYICIPSIKGKNLLFQRGKFLPVRVDQFRKGSVHRNSLQVVSPVKNGRKSMKCIKSRFLCPHEKASELWLSPQCPAKTRKSMHKCPRWWVFSASTSTPSNVMHKCIYQQYTWSSWGIWHGNGLPLSVIVNIHTTTLKARVWLGQLNWSCTCQQISLTEIKEQLGIAPTQHLMKIFIGNEFYLVQ